MERTKFITGIAVCFLPLLLEASAGGEDHPFILWTREEAASLRRKVETEPWAKAAYDAMPRGRDRGASGLPRLFAYSVLGDRAAGEEEKKLLLEGGRRRGGRYLRPLAYDILHDLLSPAEREKVEADFRSTIRSAMGSIRARRYNRWNWLPNLGYPWYLEAHLMAVALRDRALAREIFAGPFGLRWYLDEYLSDSGFYNEEFGKMYNTPDAILLWGRACRRLGLDAIGFGYRGRQGATIRGHIESVLRIGMPRVDLHTGRSHYPRITLGDAKGSRGFPGYGFQHSIVPGCLLDGSSGRGYSRWELGEWSWFELAHAQWPEGSFDYFLAQRRGLEEKRYHPSLLFNLDPVDPARVKPPPAPSGVYQARGLVVLRAEEGPAYWESPAPAVGMRLATPYAHHIQDCFSLTGFYAFNRPIFINHQHSTNYSGVDPGYSNSSRSHSTVIVDGAEPKTIGPVQVRRHFSQQAKFAAARGRGIFDGVDQTRALVLTREYLLDVSRLASDRPRHYTWIIQTLGHACPDDPAAWTASHDLGGIFFDLARERSLVTDGDWAVTAVQSSGGAHSEFSGLGEEWFLRRVGVRTVVLGEPGTVAYHAWAPVVPDAPGKWHGRDRFAFGEDEPAAVAIAAVRRKPATIFAALHEPFERRRRIASFRRIFQDGRSIAVKIQSADDLARGGYVDYVLLGLGDGAEEPRDVSAPGERFRFAGYAHVRVTDRGVRVAGDLRGMRVPAPPGMQERTLTIRGEKREAALLEGTLAFGKKVPAGTMAAPGLETPPGPGPIAARWRPDVALCLPTRGKGSATLAIRNNGIGVAGGSIALHATGGLSVEPEVVSLGVFGPGAEKTVAITVDASRAAPNRLHRLEVRPGPDLGAGLQLAALPVACGMVCEHGQVRLGDPVKTIYSPRYLARVHYMDAGAASLLLDPAGYRRSGGSGTSYPNVLRLGVDDRGREGWRGEKAGKFPYFIPVIVPGEGGRPANLYEAGRHAHGTQSGLEHWFTEDWIAIRCRNTKDGERIAFDWAPRIRRANLEEIIAGRRPSRAREKRPGKVILFTPGGEARELTRDTRGRPRWPRGIQEVLALFDRPDGYDYGSLTLYPGDSRLEKNIISQPGGSPMGFTFSTEAELETLVGKWRAHPPTGVPRKAEVDAYNAAFMPHLKEPQE